MTAICQPCDMGCIAHIKQGLRSFTNDCLIDNTEVNRVDKIKKLVELHDQLPERLIKYCWVKAGLLLNEPVADDIDKQITSIPILPQDELFDEIDEIIQHEDEEASDEDDLIEDDLIPCRYHKRSVQRALC